MDLSEGGKIPIFIGVTGHREIRPAEMPGLEKKVSKFFEAIRQLCPGTPIVVLSSLAEGADQIVARVALEDHKAGLIAPLPFPKEEYEKDFQGQTLEDFRKLLGDRPAPIVPAPDGVATAADGQRSRMYAAAGAYVVKNCNILLALWDGVRSGKTGGTAAVVGFAEEGIPEPYQVKRGLLDELETRPVYRIPTLRKNSAPSIEAGEPQKFKEFLKENPAIKMTLENIELFNSDIDACKKRNAKKFMQDREQSREYVLVGKRMKELEDASLLETEERLLGFYTFADTLANYFRKRNEFTLQCLFTLALLAVLGFEVYAHKVPHWGVLLIYPGMLLIASGIYYFSIEKGKTHQKYFDYRALAEGLRVQLFWRISGLKDQARDYYLHKQKNELGWIHRAVQAYDTLASLKGDRRDKPTRAGLKMAYHLWVDAQSDYFIGKVDEETPSIEIEKNVKNWMFLTGMAMAFIVAAADIFFHGDERYTHLHHLLIILMGLLPAAAAAMGGYADKMATSAQTKRYEWMKGIYSTASGRINGCIDQGDYEKAQAMILELGKEALEENADWVIMRRERPIEVPKG